MIAKPDMLVPNLADHAAHFGPSVSVYASASTNAVVEVGEDVGAQVHLEQIVYEDGRVEVRVWNADRTRQVIRVASTEPADYVPTFMCPGAWRGQ